MYGFDSRIRYSECGEDGRLTITSLLNYFQDCSTFQSEDLGVGVEALHGRGVMWVVNSWQIDIIKLPGLCDEVEIFTMPYEVRGFFGKRNFAMKNAAGEYLAKADSLWTYLSMESGTPERVPDDIIKAYGQDDKLDMEYLGRKISIPKDEGLGERAEDILITEHLLDANHHVNNGKYVELAAIYLPDGFKTDRLRVEYRKQAFLGETIKPFVYRADDRVAVKLADTENAPYAIVEFSKLS